LKSKSNNQLVGQRFGPKRWPQRQIALLPDPYGMICYGSTKADVITSGDKVVSLTLSITRCGPMWPMRSSISHSPRVRLQPRCSWTVPRRRPSSRAELSQYQPRCRRRPGFPVHQATYLLAAPTSPAGTCDS